MTIRKVEIERLGGYVTGTELFVDGDFAQV
jgi:hypothetical protein